MNATPGIHPTAQVHPRAEIGKDVEIGPFSVIGENVKLGNGTSIANSCLITGRTSIGANCRIFTGAVIGSAPQDLKYQGEPTEVIIGSDNVIREYATINLGTGENGRTIIGNRNLFMAYTHIAHDCRIGNETIIANAGTFGGHVVVEDRAVIGGMSAVHQFVRIGKMAMVGGCSKVVQDIAPFAMADGHPACVYGVNSLGLKRAGIEAESRRKLKQAFRLLFNNKLSRSSALRQIEDECGLDSNVVILTDFIKKSTRGYAGGSAR